MDSEVRLIHGIQITNDEKFKPKVLTVNTEEKTISYTYYNKYGNGSTSKFGYVFIGELIDKYLQSQGIK